MNSQEAVKFLTDNGESMDWAAAVVGDALVDGQADLLKWDVIYEAETGFTVTRRETGPALA